MQKTGRIDRRRALSFLSSAGATALLTQAAPAATITTCSATTPQVTEGPYWVDERLLRSDIRTDPSTGVAREGIPLSLSVTVVNSSNGACTPLAGAWIDIWHCDAIGIYSDEPSYNPGGGTGTVVTSGQKFLRGYQVADDNGQVQFTTIYPGWYSGRTIHIHARIRTFSGSTKLDDFVTQFFFDDTISDTVMAQSPYSKRTTARDTRNTSDSIYRGAANADRMMLTLSQTSSGYAASITVDTAMKTAAATSPAIASGGVVNAASGAAGVAPGAWISIYGSNLAASAHTLTSDELVSGTMPTILSGVSARINGKDAFLYYVSPTQVNVLAPADTQTGSVGVTVTTSAGTSSTVTANLQVVLPGLFVGSNYVRAVRPWDGVIVNGTGAAESGYNVAAAARPGDVLELYGTGFGATTPAMDPGPVFTGAYPTTAAVTVTIGGLAASVSWAGLVGPGLYQINVTVPSAAGDGDQLVVATINGVSSATTALLKVKA